MLGSRPVDAAGPLLYTTYAHAVYGLRAAPRPLLAVGPPLRRNDQFAL